jgi:pimeloyl-ACP methyl ester carboxylesterase
MGSAAIALAVTKDSTLADALILDSCYSRLTSASLGWWRFLGGKVLMTVLSPTVLIAAPFAGFNPFRVVIANELAKLKHVPILFLHGDGDNLALPSEAQRNFDAYDGPKQIVWFTGCNHSEGRWEQPERYREAVDGFLEKHNILAAKH